jgi:hypothetical protein
MVSSCEVRQEMTNLGILAVVQQGLAHRDNLGVGTDAIHQRLQVADAADA